MIKKKLNYFMIYMCVCIYMGLLKADRRREPPQLQSFCMIWLECLHMHIDYPRVKIPIFFCLL